MYKNLHELKALVAYLEEIDENQWDFLCWRHYPGYDETANLKYIPHNCGTVGCAIGNLEGAYPDTKFKMIYDYPEGMWRVDINGVRYEEVIEAIMDYFGMSYRQVSNLFTVNGYIYTDVSLSEISPITVANNIANWLKQVNYE